MKIIYLILVINIILLQNCTINKNCLSCENNKCILCNRLNYFFKSNDVCVTFNQNIVKNCTAYNEEFNCISCKNDYYLNNNMCSKIIQTEKTCQIKIIKNNYNEDCVCLGNETAELMKLCYTTKNRIINNCEMMLEERDNQLKCIKCKSTYILFNNICYLRNDYKDVEKSNCLIDFGFESYCFKCRSKNSNNELLYNDRLYSYEKYYNGLKNPTTPDFLKITPNYDFQYKKPFFCKSFGSECLEADIDTNKCLKCISNYYLNNNSECQLNPEIRIDNCKTYSSTTVCLNCTNNFYLTNNVCAKRTKVNNCTKFDLNSDNCLECEFNHKLESGNCNPINENQKVLNCIKTNSTGITCIECNSNYFLNNNSCILKKITGCKTYNINNDRVFCDSCDDNLLYLINPGNNQKCNQFYLKYCNKINSNKNCINCLFNKTILNNKCDGSIDNNCFSNTVNGCEICENNQAIVEITDCDNTDKNCALYNSAGNCIACNNSLTKDDNNLCNIKLNSNFENCKYGDFDNKNKCILCNRGYGIPDSNGRCNLVSGDGQCNEYQLSPSSTYTCIGCFNPDKIILSGSNCIYAIGTYVDNCIFNNSNNCTSCSSNYQLTKFTNNFKFCYYDISQTIDNCIENNGSNCIRCFNGYLLSNNSCIVDTNCEDSINYKNKGEGCFNCKYNFLTLGKSKNTCYRNDWSGGLSACEKTIEFKNNFNQWNIGCMKCKPNYLMKIIKNTFENNIFKYHQNSDLLKTSRKRNPANNLLEYDDIFETDVFIFGTCVSEKEIVIKKSDGTVHNNSTILLIDNSNLIFACISRYTLTNSECSLITSFSSKIIGGKFEEYIGATMNCPGQVLTYNINTNNYQCENTSSSATSSSNINTITNCYLYSRNNNNSSCLICNSNFILRSSNCNTAKVCNDTVDKLSYCSNCSSGTFLDQLKDTCITPNSQVLINCDFYESSSLCAKCSNNYYFNYINSTLRGCDNNLLSNNFCLKLNKSDGCNTCFNNYLNTNNTEFNRCFNNTRINSCIYYNFDGNCLECLLGYKLNLTDYKCYLDNNGCKEERNSICTKCHKNYFLSQNSCKKGYQGNCLEFNSNSNSCIKCMDGYFLYSKGTSIRSCYKIPSKISNNCTEINNNICSCKNNKIGQIMKYCSEPYDINCKKTETLKKFNKIQYSYSINNNFLCTECKDGYYIKDFKCTLANKLANCLILKDNDNTKCKSCAEGYYIDTQEKCKINPQGPKYCSVFNSQTTCKYCNENFYLGPDSFDCRLLNNNEIIRNCLYHGTNKNCLVCKSSFFLVGNSCSEITFNESNCKNYVSINECTCNNKYIFNIDTKTCELSNACEETKNNKCVLCRKDYYLNNNNQCARIKVAISKCLYNKTDSTCMVCEPNYVPNITGTKCVKMISPFIQDCLVYKRGKRCAICKNTSINPFCKQCKDINCFICDQRNLNKCLVCNSNYFMREQGRCEKSQ